MGWSKTQASKQNTWKKEMNKLAKFLKICPSKISTHRRLPTRGVGKDGAGRSRGKVTEGREGVMSGNSSGLQGNCLSWAPQPTFQKDSDALACPHGNGCPACGCVQVQSKRLQPSPHCQRWLRGWFQGTWLGTARLWYFNYVFIDICSGSCEQPLLSGCCWHWVIASRFL